MSLAYSVHVSDIFTCTCNSSLIEGCVPQTWKDANVVPIPKETPATITKLRHISLTALQAKICEGFVSKWVLEDICTSIGRNQYGSIQGSSTTHCLIELLDVLYRYTDKADRVGTLVVTDFSRAFDCVDHTLAIQRLHDLGVRSEITPSIDNFLTALHKRVQYLSALSEWETIS